MCDPIPERLASLPELSKTTLCALWKQVFKTSPHSVTFESIRCYRFLLGVKPTESCLLKSAIRGFAEVGLANEIP